MSDEKYFQTLNTTCGRRYSKQDIRDSFGMYLSMHTLFSYLRWFLYAYLDYFPSHICFVSLKILYSCVVEANIMNTGLEHSIP